jgi:hypothetical protein
MACACISEFESYQPSHAVGLWRAAEHGVLPLVAERLARGEHRSGPIALFACWVSVERLRSAAEVVAYVGVAVAGIVAQAPVQWKRLVGLDDAVAGAVNGGRVVRGDSQRRAQRRRSRKAGRNLMTAIRVIRMKPLLCSGGCFGYRR